MKTDLLTAIVIGIIGVVAGYFVTSSLMGEIPEVTVKTVESSVNANLAEPDPEVFNYRALNPTVEVCVGDCTDSNETPAPQEGE